MAQYSQQRRERRSRTRLSSAYAQGLDYLLNNQTDKASEVLIRLVDVDPDTVELHLVLGSLFRRRGEVDRAIAIHQNIIDRSESDEVLRDRASLELGRDFLRAGLLDRAEQLLLALLERRRYEKAVCQHLIDVYQQLKEWRKALAIGERLVSLDSEVWKPQLAQYHCEIAEAALRRHDLDAALLEAKQARVEDPLCVRATLLMGNVLQQKGDYLAAIETYRQVEEQNPGLMPEVAVQIENCYERLGRRESWEDYLGGLLQRHSDLEFLLNDCWGQRLGRATEGSARYCCEQCGFTSSKLFWQCPGCQSWSSVKPRWQACRT